MDSREVVLYCDLHGHSRKMNVFMYGNGRQGRYKQERMYPAHYFADLIPAAGAAAAAGAGTGTGEGRGSVAAEVGPHREWWHMRRRERCFPRLLADNAPQFSFADCAFKINKSKEGTSRVRHIAPQPMAMEEL